MSARPPQDAQKLFRNTDVADPYPLADFANVVSWRCVWDKDFNQATSPVLVADNANILVHSVTETINQASRTFTEVVIPVPDMNTSELVALIGTSEEINSLNMELVGIDGNGDENPSVENSLITGLQKNGFSRIVDLTQIEASVKQRIANAIFDGDYGLEALGSHFNVDYLVTGYLDLNTNGIPLIEDYPFVGSLNNVAVNLSVRMLNANTGEIVYAGSADGQAFNLGAKAMQEALKKATAPIVKELSKSALQKAANPEQHVTILVTNNRLGSMSDAYAFISNIPGVSGVYTRTKQAGVMQIDVDYHGTAYDLAQALEHEGITIREMTSEYIRI